MANASPTRRNSRCSSASRRPRPPASTRTASLYARQGWSSWRSSTASTRFGCSTTRKTRPALCGVVDHDLVVSTYFCDPDGNRYEITTYERNAVIDAVEPLL
ncbi:hypothetical protein ACNS7O_14480 [Haloferacaceae archaeon DSL9]